MEDDLKGLLLTEEELEPTVPRPPPDFPPLEHEDSGKSFADPIERFKLDEDFDYDKVPFVPRGFTAEEQDHLNSFKKEYKNDKRKCVVNVRDAGVSLVYTSLTQT